MRNDKIIDIHNPYEHLPHYIGYVACTHCGYVTMNAWPVTFDIEGEPSECDECDGMHRHMVVWNRAALEMTPIEPGPMMGYIEEED